jgi:hypothetical protein
VLVVVGFWSKASCSLSLPAAALSSVLWLSGVVDFELPYAVFSGLQRWSWFFLLVAAGPGFGCHVGQRCSCLSPPVPGLLFPALVVASSVCFLFVLGCACCMGGISSSLTVGVIMGICFQNAHPKPLEMRFCPCAPISLRRAYPV